MFFSTDWGAAHSLSFSMASLISFSMPISSKSGVSYWLCGNSGQISKQNSWQHTVVRLSLLGFLTLLMSCLRAVEISVSFSAIILCRPWSCCSLNSRGRALPLRKASLARCTACLSMQSPSPLEVIIHGLLNNEPSAWNYTMNYISPCIYTRPSLAFYGNDQISLSPYPPPPCTVFFKTISKVVDI